ncbi:hypothetical protein PC114_g11812 [Phytophthora cactorum]|nr:hypothetical protein PC112_g10780 [Phytophthora cactorum]KAG2904562.1 hypothetical protein PC114_g11812 [Phytophthora cactorum]KAG3083564.1 hypothetical protein PC122_g10495 [Phytophthora cactorum]
MIDDAARDGAHAPTPTLAADRERIGIANDTEVKSNAVARERGDGTTDDQVLAVDNDQALEMLMIMRGLAGRLERLEQSQSKLEKKLDDEEKRVRAVDPPMTLKPLRVGLGCGARQRCRRSTSGSTSLGTVYHFPSYSGSLPPRKEHSMHDLAQQPQEARV